MERITYRITLDAHRNGIQRTLQGFETADKMARRISINLVEGSDTFELPMMNVVAMMYVTTPSAKKPSVNECVIDGNTIIYDCEPIVEEGITEMQLKVLESSPEGAKKVLVSPKFVVEVTKSNTDDSGATQTQTFTALEQAIAKADGVYNSRILRVVIEEDCIFKVYYADGTVYENDYFRDAMYNGNALLSQSYAVGGAGVRQGEDTDNSKYYSNVSRSASEDAKKVYEDSHELMRETQMQANYTYFKLNFESGELGYVSTNTEFNINKETGDLETNRNETYTPEDIIAENVDLFINEKSQEIDGDIEELKEKDSKMTTDIQKNLTDITNLQNQVNTVEAIAKGRTLALSFDTYGDMITAVKETSTEWNVGQNIYIGTKEVPDLWVSGVSENWNNYSYVDEQSVADEIKEFGYIQIGYYALLPLETEKVDLTEYAKSNYVDEKTSESKRYADSTFVDKNRIVVVEGTLSGTIQHIDGFPNNSPEGGLVVEIDFPTELNFDTTIVLNVMVAMDEDSFTTSMPVDVSSACFGFDTSRVWMTVSPWDRNFYVTMAHQSMGASKNRMHLNVCNLPAGDYTIPYKIVLFDYNVGVG